MANPQLLLASLVLVSNGIGDDFPVNISQLDG